MSIYVHGFTGLSLCLRAQRRNIPVQHALDSAENRTTIEENSMFSADFSDSIVIQAEMSDPACAEVIDLIERLDSEVLRREDLYAFTEQDLIYIWQVMQAQASRNFHQDAYRTYFEALD